MARSSTARGCRASRAICGSRTGRSPRSAAAPRVGPSASSTPTAASWPPVRSTCTPTTTPRSVGTRGARSPAGTASRPWCSATAGSASPPASPTSVSARCSRCAAPRPSPTESMRAGFLPHWDWETIPEYLDSLDAAPLGVNVLQYMPTASLMTYVMGLEAAKSRPATAAERKEMQRLLHEGMDAGLCGFSIQRLGPELGAGRFRRHPDGDRHDDRRRHLLPGRGAARAGRGLHPADPGHQPEPERPRATWTSSCAWPRWPSGRSSTTRCRSARRTRASTRSASSGRPPPRRRACASSPRPPPSAPASPSPSTTGTSTTRAPPGVRPPPARSRRRCARCATRRCGSG